MKQIKEKAFIGVMNEWTEMYKQESRKCRYNIDITGPPFLDEELQAIRIAKKGRDVTINFIQHYCSFILLSGFSVQVLERLKTFLSYQHFADEFFDENKIPEFEITFQGSIIRGAITVNFNDFREFDFADTFSILEYELIYILNRRQKTWTQKRIKQIITDIKDDLEYDGYEAELSLSMGEVGQPANESIEITCFIR